MKRIKTDMKWRQIRINPFNPLDSRIYLTNGYNARPDYRLFKQQQCQHHPNAAQKREKLKHGSFRFFFFVQFRNQIAPRDIQKSAGGKRDKDGGEMFRVGVEQKRHDCAEDGEERRGKVEEQGFPFCQSSMQEHAKVADFLRYFVENHREGGRNAHGDAYQVTDTNREPVEKVVNAVAHEVGERKRVRVVGFSRRVVAVAPMDDFFHGKHDDNAREQRERNREADAVLFRNFGQQMQEDVAKQSAGGKAHHEKQEFFEFFEIHGERERSHERDRGDRGDACDGQKDGHREGKYRRYCSRISERKKAVDRGGGCVGEYGIFRNVFYAKRRKGREAGTTHSRRSGRTVGIRGSS